MSNIFGPAGPFMHPDQIFCYNPHNLNDDATVLILHSPDPFLSRPHTKERKESGYVRPRETKSHSLASNLTLSRLTLCFSLFQLSSHAFLTLDLLYN